MTRFSFSGIWFIYGLVGVTLLLVAISLFGSLAASFSVKESLGETWTISNYSQVLQDGEFGRVLLNTILLGAGSVAVMLFFSIPISWLLARTDFAWKGLLFSLLTAKMAIPGFITAMSYVFLFNPSNGIVNKLLGFPFFNVYSLPWICFLQGLVLTPVAVFMILPTLRNIDPALEEAARVSGVTYGQMIRRIVLPLAGPAIAAATIFFFIVAVEIFDFVALIGMPGGIEVLSVLIYDKTHPSIGSPDYGLAGAYGMVLFAITAIAILFYIRFLRQSQKYAVVGGKRRFSPPQPLKKLRWPANVFVLAWIFLAFVIPILTLGWTSLVPYLQPPSMSALSSISMQSYGFALSYLGEPFRNTVGVMIGAVLIGVISSTCISWVVTRSRNRLGRWVDFLVFLSPAVPSMVAALAFQYFGLKIHQWIPIYGTIWLVSLAMSTRMLAFCTRTMNASAMQLHKELDEAAYASGISKFTAFRKIFIPLIAPAVFYSAVMVAMMTAKELTIPLMINTGGTPLVSTLIYDLQSSGYYDSASAVGLYMIFALVALTLTARAVTGMGEEKDAFAKKRFRRNKVNAGLSAPERLQKEM